MPTFNPNNYFATKLDDATRSKVLDIQAASQAKIAALDAQSKQFAAQREAERQAYEASWVGKLGLEPTGFVANRVNDVASLVSGTSRLAGQLASLPSNIASAMDLSGITQEDTDAYNRYQAGTATPQDLSLLQSPKTTGKSVYQSIEDAKASQGTATAVADTFKLDKIVDPTNRNALAKDLGQDFEASWNKVTEGWDEGKKGNFLDSVSGIASGLGGLLANAGEAVVTNPNAVKEYVLENAPQLLVGAYGKAGKAALAASNVGYAFDTYRQGMENYAKTHGGQLPSEEERSRMATLATTLALAEQASDVFTLGLAKVGGKAAKTAEQLAQDASQSALKGIGKATLGGIASEAPTEGYQTWAEGEITGKPATAKDIYTGAVIGGAAGAGLTGGLRTLAEVTGTTEEKLAKREVDAKRADVIRTAVDTGNVDAFLDPKAKSYAPDQAIAALFGNSQKDGTTDEAKQQNLARAGQIVSDLEQQRTKASELLQASSPEAVVALKAELVKAQADGDTEYVGLLQAQIDDIEGNPKVAERLAAQVTDLDSKLAKAQEAFKLFNQESVKDVDVEAEVAKIKANDDTSSGAADNVINLSMAAPERIDTTLAMELANDSTNGLSTTQRDYLRSFSEAQRVISDAKTIKGVSKDIFEGGEGFKGLPEYQKAISSYLAAGNKEAADRELSQLRDFLQTRTSKLKAAQAALDQATASGTPVQIVRTDGAWSVNTGAPIDMKTAEPGSVMEISKNSVNLIRNLGIEAQAIRAVGKTMRAAYDLKTAPKAAQPQTQQTAQPRQQEQTNGTQATETQQAEAQGSQASESAGSTPAANADEVTAPAQEETQPATESSSTLSVMDPENRSPEGTLFNQRKNLLADFFKQKTDRPLGMVKGLLSKLLSKEVTPESLGKEMGPFSVKEQALLDLFGRFAKSATPKLLAGLSKAKSPEFRYKNLMQFFQVETENGIDLDENTKTAILLTAFNFVADNGAYKGLWSDKQINKYLGKDEKAPVDPDVRKALVDAGISRTQLIEQLGMSAYQALGLQPEDAPIDLEPKMITALGAHALRILWELKIIQPKTVDAQKLGFAKGQTAKGVSLDFFQIVRSEDGKPSARVQQILDAKVGTSNFLQRLFGVDPVHVAPSLEPIEFNQQMASKSSMRVPGEQREKLAVVAKLPYRVRQDNYALYAVLGRDAFVRMATGSVTPEEYQHEIYKLKYEAQREGVERSIDNWASFVEGTLLQPGTDLATDFYIEPVVWSNQRMGNTTNLIDPQQNPEHRYLIGQPTWETTIKLSDEAAINRLLYGIGQSMGFSGTMESVLLEVAAARTEPEIKAALAALEKVRSGADITEAEKAAIEKGVMSIGTELQGLDGLQALLELTLAERKGGDTEFTVQLNAGTDGVSNGVILSHLLLGAASTPEELIQVMNKGGIYEDGNPETDFDSWHDQPGNFDSYEQATADMVEALSPLMDSGEITPEVFNALWVATRPLLAGGKVTKDGRKFAKGAVPPIIFGSSIDNAVNGLAVRFVESVYSGFEKYASKPTDLKAFVDGINVLIAASGVRANPIPTGRGFDFYLQYQISADQKKALYALFNSTLGNAMTEALEKNYAALRARQSALNSVATTTFDIYNAVLEGQKTAETLRGDVQRNSVGQPVHDITKGQESKIKKALNRLRPVMHSLYSKRSKDLGSGLFMGKFKRISTLDPLYSNQIAFGTPLPNGASSMRAQSDLRGNVGPGVKMGPVSTHSFDATVSLDVQALFHTQNNHDELVTGINEIEAMSRALNEHTFKNSAEYSPLNEAYQALRRSINELHRMASSGELSPEAMDNLVEAFETKAWKAGYSSIGDMLRSQLVEAKLAAYNADKIKLETMLKLSAVNQYAYPGGAYMVTAEDKAAIQEQLSKLSNVVQQETLDAATALDGFLKPAVGRRIERMKAAKKQKAEQQQEAQNQEVYTGENAQDDDTEFDLPDPVIEPISKDTPFGKMGKPSIESDADLVSFFESNPEATAEQVIALLAQPGRLNPVNRKLLQLASRIVGKNLPVRFITDPNQEVLEAPSVPSRGWYVSNASGEAIHVLGPQFKASGLTAETLLHELVHAALAKTIANPSAAAAELVAELEDLRLKAKHFVEGNPALKEFLPAVTHRNPQIALQEFVAWGMTNRAFQRDVLTKIQMASKTKGNALVTAMQKFVETLSKLLFKKPSEEINNGLSVLISNVSGLAYEAAQGGQKETRLNLSQESNEAVDAYTTLDLFTALDNGTVEPRFQAHLGNLLAGMVEKLHGPFGAFRDAMRKTEAGNPLAVWLKAMETGEAPFASAIVASGFAGSAQEDFAMQQIEATIKAALDGNEATTKAVYRELYNLYTEMRQKLKPSDFASQEDYDFVFKIDAGNGGRSDYLARFAALGLGSQKFNKLLQVATEVTAPAEARTLVEKLTDLFQKVLNFFNEKITRVYQGQQADEKLLSLVNNLVDIEAKKRMSLLSTEQDLEKDAEAKIKASVDGIKSKISDLANSNLIKNSSSNIVKFGGAMVQIATKGILDKYIDEIRKFYDVQTKEKHGIAMGLLSELVGPQEAYRELHRARKHQEQMRKSVISKTSKLVKSMFANNGKDLTDGAKTALTRVFLRTGMHNLLDQYSVQQMDALLASKAGLQAEIDKLKATLPAHVAAAYLEQVNALGYYNATGKSRTQVLMLNAHLIARMAGTKYQGQITEQQANQVQQTIATLVTLFSVKYAQDTDKAAALQLLRTENNRTDGKNGVEFMLALHKQMEQESEAKLFKESPALMVHGYTPEITNPHTLFEVATEEEGKLLLEQGYVKGAEVKNDAVDPSPTKHIYVMRDGGLAPWLSGIMSVTDLHTKGSAQNIDIPGLTAAQTRSSITADKLSKMDQRKNPERDLNNETGNNLVPVFNANGDIVDWRYMMADATKDTLLERDNSFDSILGALAGSVYDKETASEVNERMVTALREQFEAEYALQKDSYMEVSASSPDLEIQEMWRLLPESTKKTIRKVWGRDSMMVRKDVLDITFGYRKYSLAEAFRKDPSMRNDFERLTLNTLEAVLVASGRTPEQAQNHIKRIGARVAKGERIWQEIVKEIKDIVVVKNVTTLVGNIYSNFSLLSIKGVPWKDMIHHHTVAIKGALAYERDTARLFDLEKQLESGVMGAAEAELRHEIARLKDLIARNPVKELMDAGLMPTIVEDIENEDDIYSYKSAFSQKAERFVSRLPTPIKEAGKFVYMTHDTKLYQFLSHTTQLSDFVARYTLYQHVISRKDNPLSKQDAIREADESFINYDIALPKKVQYLDDLGILPFTKYFLRIQRVLVKSFRENPARVLSLALLNNFMNLGPIVLDSSFIHHIGNMPLYGGALRFPQTLDELATVKAAMALVK